MHHSRHSFIRVPSIAADELSWGMIEDWRRDLKGKITWALVLKLLGLVLLWLLFFRGRGS
jgi:hypothetical protein